MGIDRLKVTIDQNDIYLFGPMGSGRTTLVSRLRNDCGDSVNYVSIGEIVRDKLAANDPETTHIIQTGAKMPLEYVATIVSPYIRTDNRIYLMAFRGMSMKPSGLSATSTANVL